MTDYVGPGFRSESQQCDASRPEASGVTCDEYYPTTIQLAALPDPQGKVGARDGRGDALPSRNADGAEPVVRDGGGRGALRRATTIRQSNLAEGGEPRDVEFEVYRNVNSRSAPRRANVGEESRLHCCGGSDAGARHRREHGYFQCGQFRFAQAASLSRA